jgi:hypothetical protein
MPEHGLHPADGQHARARMLADQTCFEIRRGASVGGPGPLL